MSEFHPRNKWNEHLSDSEYEKRRRKAYLRELASIASNGTREDTNRVAKELEAEDFFDEMDKHYEETKKRRKLTDEDLDKLVDDLITGNYQSPEDSD